MSKVLAPAPAAPVDPQAQPGDGWVLDESDGHDSRWILNDAEAPAAEPPAAAPVVPPAAPAAPGTAAGQGYQYTTETGHTFRGNTPDEVLKHMEQAVIRSATLAANSQSEIERARRAVAEQTQLSRGGAPPVPASAPFDAQEYYRLLADAKPIEAYDYMMRTRYGIENFEEFAGQANTAYSIATKMRDISETADFKQANPDFPYNAQAVELLLRRVTAHGMEPTRWNLETAKNQLYGEGVLSPIAQADPATHSVIPPPMVPQSRGFQAPPAPRSVGGDPGERELSPSELESLPIEQHRAYLRKRGHNV